MGALRDRPSAAQITAVHALVAIVTAPIAARVTQADAAEARLTRAEAAEAVPLEEVPALVLMEVLGDVDLFVGVSSVGVDPTWYDRGPEQQLQYWRQYAFGELTESVRTLKDVLSTLPPCLTALQGRWQVEDRYLVVRGELRTYEIHLGSANIRMAPNDQYLCIVRARGAAPARSDLFLPFEGDGTLSEILSKALLLVRDKAITDPSILRQIRGCAPPIAAGSPESRVTEQEVVQPQDRDSKESNLVIGMQGPGAVHPQVEALLQCEDVPRSSCTVRGLVDSVVARITEAPAIGTQSKRATRTSRRSEQHHAAAARKGEDHPHARTRLARWACDAVQPNVHNVAGGRLGSQPAGERHLSRGGVA
jgi:hypothetical protein